MELAGRLAEFATQGTTTSDKEEGDSALKMATVKQSMEEVETQDQTVVDAENDTQVEKQSNDEETSESMEPQLYVAWKNQESSDEKPSSKGLEIPSDEKTTTITNMAETTARASSTDNSNDHSDKRRKVSQKIKAKESEILTEETNVSEETPEKLCTETIATPASIPPLIPPKQLQAFKPTEPSASSVTSVKSRTIDAATLSRQKRLQREMEERLNRNSSVQEFQKSLTLNSLKKKRGEDVKHTTPAARPTFLKEMFTPKQGSVLSSHRDSLALLKSSTKSNFSDHRDSIRLLKSSGKLKPKNDSKFEPRSTIASRLSSLYEALDTQSKKDKDIASISKQSQEPSSTLTETQLEKLEIEIDEIKEFEKQEQLATEETKSSPGSSSENNFANTDVEPKKKVLTNLVRADTTFTSFVAKKPKQKPTQAKSKPKVAALEFARQAKERLERQEQARQQRKENHLKMLKQKRLGLGKLPMNVRNRTNMEKENQNQNLPNKTDQENRIQADKAMKKAAAEEKRGSEDEYCMTDGYESDETESDSEVETQRKRPAAWASKKAFAMALYKQSRSQIDPDE